MADNLEQYAANTARLRQYAHAAPRCAHIKINGTRCKSPAMNNHQHCYFHRGLQKAPERDRPEIGNLEDANAIQVAIQNVLHALLRGAIGRSNASLLLYGLQTASSNLLKCSFEPGLAEEVMLDDQGNTLADLICDDPACHDCQPSERPPLSKFVEPGSTDPVKARHKRMAWQMLYGSKPSQTKQP